MQRHARYQLAADAECLSVYDDLFESESSQDEEWIEDYGHCQESTMVPSLAILVGPLREAKFLQERALEDHEQCDSAPRPSDASIDSDWSVISSEDTNSLWDRIEIDGVSDQDGSPEYAVTAGPEVEACHSDASASRDEEQLANDLAIAQLLTEDEQSQWRRPKIHPREHSSEVTPRAKTSVDVAVHVVRPGISSFPPESFSTWKRAMRNSEHITRKLQLDDHSACSSSFAHTLARRLGICVVCSESIATVVMEPCGHLSLCGACHDAWVKTNNMGIHQVPCVYCRTRGVGLHLLSSHAKIDDIPSISIRVEDGCIWTPSHTMAETPMEMRNHLREYKRAKRRLSRQITTASGRPIEDDDRAGWAQYGRALQEWRREKKLRRDLLNALQSYSRARQASAFMQYVHMYDAFQPHGRRRYLNEGLPTCSAVRRAIEFLRQPLRRPDLPVFRYIESGRRFGSKGYIRMRICNEKCLLWYKYTDGVRAMQRQQQERAERARALDEAVESAVIKARNLVDAAYLCVECEKQEACMMFVPCHHIPLCRICWETRPREKEACTQCGMQCELALCVRRP